MRSKVRVSRTRSSAPSERTARRRARPSRGSSWCLLRTIVVRRGDDDYVFVLVPGGRRFDWPKVRAQLGVKRLSLPDAEEARTATGYERGAITPFGSARAWPVIADVSILGLDRVAIGGGAHGVNIHLSPTDMIGALDAEVVDVTVPDEG